MDFGCDRGLPESRDAEEVGERLLGASEAEVHTQDVRRRSRFVHDPDRRCMQEEHLARH